MRAAGEGVEGQAAEAAVRRGGGLWTETLTVLQKARDSRVFQKSSYSQGQTLCSPRRRQRFCSL